MDKLKSNSSTNSDNDSLQVKLSSRKGFSDSEAKQELMEILSEPFHSKCDKCRETGVYRSRPCPFCDGKGYIRIDFL